VIEDPKRKVQERPPVVYSAVIFGINTRVGRAYAYYLARMKFNLILIERNVGPMNELETDMKVAGLTPHITKIVLDKFDQDTLNRQLINELKVNQDVLSPVKIFINCKNSRRAVDYTVPEETMPLSGSMMADSLLMEDSSLFD
jgi:hypothetical protein